MSKVVYFDVFDKIKMLKRAGFDPLDQDLIEIWWLGDSNISSGAINIDYLDDYNE